MFDNESGLRIFTKIDTIIREKQRLCWHYENKRAKKVLDRVLRFSSNFYVCALIDVCSTIYDNMVFINGCRQTE